MNDRTASLEAFASQTTIEGQVLSPATVTHAPPPALVHGAQKMVVARDEARVLQRIRTLAHAAGDAWYYRIPFRDKRTNRTTYVEGPSIKLANDVARLYGNCDVDEWVSGEGIDYWEFTARFIDLETGFALTRVFRQRKNAAAVGNDAARNAEIGFAIGASKAIRNVITNGLQTFSDYAYEEARNALVTTIGKDIERWRKEVSERIGALTDIKRVEAVIGRTVKEWLAPDIATVAAMGKAIKDGMASVDDSFPPLQRQEHASTKDQLDKATTQKPVERDDDGVAYEASEGDDARPSEDVAMRDATEGAADDATSGSRMADEAASTSAAPDPERAQQRKDAINKMFGLAINGDFDEAQRLSMLEDAAGLWEEVLDTEFFTALVKNSVSLVKGHIKESAARKIMETFK